MLEKQYIQDIKNYKLKKEKKNSFKIRANNTVRTLKEVECFLNNWKKVQKGLNLYKFFKY